MKKLYWIEFAQLTRPDPPVGDLYTIDPVRPLSLTENSIRYIFIRYLSSYVL